MKRLIIAALVGTLAGCANLPPELSGLGDKAQQALARLSGRGASLDTPLPADGIKARDQGLTAALGKVGRFAAKQPEPMTITVYAPRIDHDYLMRSIKAGIPAEKAAAITINTEADDAQPRVSVRTTREAKKA